MASQRTIRTREEINAWMTSELSSNTDCGGSRIQLQYALKQPDEDGCNWSDSCILNHGPNISLEQLTPIATQVVTSARKQFNLPD